MLPFYGLNDVQMSQFLSAGRGQINDINSFNVNFDTFDQDRYTDHMYQEHNLLAELDQRNLSLCTFGQLDQIRDVILGTYFSLVHLNVGSLVAHLDELELVLADLGTPVVIGLSETWLRPNNESLYCIPGYSIVPNSHSNRASSGVALLISNKVSYKLVPDLQLSCPEVAEAIFIEVEINQTKTIVGEIYRPPSGMWPDFLRYLTHIF